MASKRGIVDLSTKIKYSAGWGKTIDSLIKDLGAGGKVIRASILVKPGYDYWWFLEYGTSPAESNPDPSPSDRIQLTPPASIGRKLSKRHASNYLILPKGMGGNLGVTPLEGGGAQIGRYVQNPRSKYKAISFKKLVFYNKFGVKQKRLGVLHPGIEPVFRHGVIRMAIYRSQLRLIKKLNKLFDEATVDRDDIVDVINFEMSEALDEIQANFPDNRNAKNRAQSMKSRPRPSGHLSSAFSMRPAE